MPLYHFRCDACGKQVRKLLTPAQSGEPRACPEDTCSGSLLRTPKPPTSNVVETLDNGFMVRRLERPADAERLYKERAAKDPLGED